MTQNQVILDILFEYQQGLLARINFDFVRAAYAHIDWDQRMLGIIGSRGAGKTTLLLQHVKLISEKETKPLYVAADHPYFYDHSLYELAREFVQYGGTHLFIDEIHKYPAWSRELKIMYDAHPELHIVFTASSALEVLKGEADLSRRTVTYELPGLSFREFLEFYHGYRFPVVKLEEVLNGANAISEVVNNQLKPLSFFREYVERGYLPFGKNETPHTFLQKQLQILNQALETDLQFIEGHSAPHTHRIKQLLGVIAESVPFQPNITKIAARLQLGRDTIKSYLLELERAHILNLIHKKGKGVSTLQKPDKIYLENPNLSYALKQTPDMGTIRETFVLNQLRNANIEIWLAEKGDFIIQDDITIEIGGSGKSDERTKTVPHVYIVKDDIEHAFLNRIPLWLFGFLY